MILGIIITIIVGILITTYYLSKAQIDVFLDKDNKPITTQDGIEDVVIDEKTIHVKVHEKDRVKKTTQEIVEDNNLKLKKEILEKETPFDEPVDYSFEKKEETSSVDELKGVRTLTDHIATVIELHPDSKKRLTKRERKTVDKIVKEKSNKK
jgi:hypothetical protein